MTDVAGRGKEGATSTHRRRAVGLAVGAAIAPALGIILHLNRRPSDRWIEHRIERLYDLDSPQLRRATGVLLGPPIVAGNRVDVLLNGAPILPAMLDAIRQARRTITLETCIHGSGAIGQAFADALSERPRAGVRGHVLLDWVGSQRMDEAPTTRTLVDALQRGVRVRIIVPGPHIGTDVACRASRAGSRTRRGMRAPGASRRWRRRPRCWRCSCEAPGRATGALQSLFAGSLTRGKAPHVVAA